MISFAFAGVLSLILIWVLNALYLGVTVFVSDYCTSPDQYILTVAEKNQMKYCKIILRFKFLIISKYTSNKLIN